MYRALWQLQLTERLQAISSVSGGSWCSSIFMFASAWGLFSSQAGHLKRAEGFLFFFFFFSFLFSFFLVEVLPRGRSLGPYGCGCQNRFGVPFWQVNAPPILVGILVVGLGCSLGVRDFDVSMGSREPAFCPCLAGASHVRQSLDLPSFLLASDAHVFFLSGER